MLGGGAISASGLSALPVCDSIIAGANEARRRFWDRVTLMAIRKRRKRKMRLIEQHRLLLEPDKLGLLVASIMATLVMAACFYWQEVNDSVVGVRVALTFTISYSMTFILVLFMQRVLAQEMPEAEEETEEEGVSSAEGETGSSELVEQEEIVE